MLPKENRLSKQENFDLVKVSGKSFRCDGFIFSYLNREDDSPTRFGFIVTKQIDNRATERNLIVRKLRNAIRPQLNNLKNGFDCVVVAHFTIKNKSLEEVAKEIEIAFTKANII